MVFYIDGVVKGCNFQKYIYLSRSEVRKAGKVVFIQANIVDPDEMMHYATFILAQAPPEAWS